MLQSSLEQQAEAALNVADDRPRQALASALTVGARASTAGDHRAASAASRAQGLALLHLHDVDHAVESLEAAVGEALLADAADLEGRARMTLAAALCQLGRRADALHEADLAVQTLKGLDQARAFAQRGFVQLYLDDFDGAIASFANAEPVLRHEQDHENLLSALLNRGALRLQHGQLSTAASDLREAVELAERLGRELRAGYAHANLGLAYMGGGEILEALDHFAAAEVVIRRSGGAVGPLLTMRGELLLSVRLLAEAREAATAALRAASRVHDHVAEADTRVLLAQVAMLEGRPAEAERMARAAERICVQHGQDRLAAFARLQALRAALAGGSTRLPTVAEVDAVVDAVSAAGWAWSRVEARIAAAEVVLRRSARRNAVTDGGNSAIAYLAAAARFRGVGPATVRGRAWYAEARRRELLGDARGAGRAAAAGLRVLDEYAQALGATDLRAHAAGHRTDLVEIGLRTALRAREPRRVLLWAERGRASHLQRPRVRPPADPVLSELLTKLRAAAAEVDELDRAGQSSRAAVRRQVAIEKRVRDHVRLAAARTRPKTSNGARGAASDPGGPASTSTIRMATRMATRTATRSVPALVEAVDGVLGERALVEYVVADRAIHAVTFAEGRARLHRLGGVDQANDLLPRIPFALQRLLRARRDPRSARAGRALLDDAGRRLDDLLLAPLRETEGHDLVVVPTGPLQAVPWSLLPSVDERAVTVVPATALWVTTMTRTYSAGPVTVVAGPGLPGADDEARAVADLYGAEPLTGGQGTVAATSQLISGAGLAHLAAHGRLSADNPLFSSLTLADGPLFVHDLEHVAALPHTVVLAACDSGRNAVLAGDELLGLGGTFLAGGSAQLVASVVPVPDHETGTLMAALHRELIAGSVPATALRRAQRELADTSPAAFAAAAGFVCLGAGYLPPPLAPAPGSPSVREEAPSAREEALTVPTPRLQSDAGSADRTSIG